MITGEPPLEMSALFKKTDSILDEVQDAARSIDGSSKNMQAISDKINNGSGTVGALINDKSLYNEVNSSAQEFQEDAEALKHNFLLKGFFQKRGYEDTGELTRNAIQQLPAEPYDKKFELDARGLFDKPDATKLKNDKPLKPVGEFLQNNPFGLVVVAALSGMKGDTGKDNQLTLARAAVVRDYLVKNFRLDDTHIKTIGLGKNPDTPDAGEVEVMVYPAAPRHR
jgi:outer membrane protein OmpA-like peptidoglycan-associated protein